MARFKRESSEIGVQTISFEEIRQQFEVQVQALEKQLEGKEEERERVQREIYKAKMRLEQVNYEVKLLLDEQKDL